MIYSKNRRVFSSTLILFHVLGCFSFGIAQNLVPNPSFEDTVMCPDAGAQVSRARHWFIVDQTPDYFHSCCVYPQFSIPNNTVDFQYAATGNAYTGFLAYSTVDPNYREKLGVGLIAPLSIGTRYFVSFKVSATKNYVNAACNKLGVLFSTTQFNVSNPPQTNNQCHVWSDSIIKDTTNWTVIKGSFIADSSYTYLNIGNFFQNVFVDTMSFWYVNSVQAYYILDDVCVSQDSTFCNEFQSVDLDLIDSYHSFRVFPNPSSNILKIESNYYKNFTIELRTMEGTILHSQLSNSFDQIALNVSQLSDGLYLLVVYSAEEKYTFKILVQH